MAETIDIPPADGQPREWFYATVRRPKGDGHEARPLRGPFDTREAAQAALAEAYGQVTAIDPDAVHYEFGVARCLEDQGPGILDLLDMREASQSARN
jgi:hypothetical protein